MASSSLHATACIGCRRRGRKCDRTLPTCHACEKRGTPCEGYITKWPGVAARGKLAGKSIPVMNSSAGIAQSHAQLTRAQQKRTRPDASSFTNEEIDKFVQHYIADLSSIFYLGSGPSENPMFHYVLPLISNISPIRFALAGSASCHIAARTSDEALERKSLRLRVHATYLLREMLQTPGGISDQSILASILMLAQLDMCSGDCTEFEMHLKAAVAVIRGPRYDGEANRYYFEQRLAWLDVMSSTTSQRPPNLTIEEVKTIVGRFSSNGHRQWSYDVFPCPIDLFEIITETTFLFKAQPAKMKSRTQDLERRLNEWKPPLMTGARKHMVEAWRLGIKAYLHRLFPDAQNEEPLSNQVLALAELIPPASSWSYALLWPIFQVAVTLGDENIEEKNLIRRRLKIALETIGCRHHSNALEVLEVVWAKEEEFDHFSISIPGRTIMLV
ncbi:hypothetical protein NW768_010041 [Fusarium equiseti]|uniref:Zn(2)-C6 fungal-type domain-containing protein n=1 Tax=Fusarium equiseti TaxID=61235 RepID=A0ABQ8R1F8_FUSEQ|nr:hypothetical protein NW768_010041 [Fusarium equiseti]